MPAPVPTPLVIAHRGDSAHRPENTLAAFASALEIGAAHSLASFAFLHSDEFY